MKAKKIDDMVIPTLAIRELYKTLNRKELMVFKIPEPSKPLTEADKKQIDAVIEQKIATLKKHKEWKWEDSNLNYC